MKGSQDMCTWGTWVSSPLSHGELANFKSLSRIFPHSCSWNCIGWKDQTIRLHFIHGSLWRSKLYHAEPWRVPKSGKLLGKNSSKKLSFGHFPQLGIFREQVHRPCFWCRKMDQWQQGWNSSWELPGNGVNLRVSEFSHFLNKKKTKQKTKTKTIKKPREKTTKNKN